jgi:hypothetical protein
MTADVDRCMNSVNVVWQQVIRECQRHGLEWAPPAVAGVRGSERTWSRCSTSPATRDRSHIMLIRRSTCVGSRSDEDQRGGAGLKQLVMVVQLERPFETKDTQRCVAYWTHGAKDSIYSIDQPFHECAYLERGGF